MKNTQTASAPKEKKPFFSPNPVMKKVLKGVQAEASGDKATYGGITVKTFFFLLMTVVGIVGYLTIRGFGVFGTDYIEGLKYDNFEFTITLNETFFLLGTMIVTVICQLLAAFVPKTIPVTGTLYSIGQGFILSCIIFTVLGYTHNEYLGLLALVITIIVVFTMSILYAKRIVKVNKKFMTVLLTLAFGMIILSLVTLVCAFIPGVNTFVSQILGNFWVSLILSILSLVIATLFLLAEFAQMETVVSEGYPAKCEWSVAFGLAFTILWIYFKILEIIIRIAGNSRN